MPARRRSQAAGDRKLAAMILVAVIASLQIGLVGAVAAYVELQTRPLQGSYVAHQAGGVAFLTFRGSPGALYGTYDFSTTAASGAAAQPAPRYSFTATRNGNNLTVTFTVLVYGTLTIHGHFDGSNLSLALPRPGGRLVTVTMHPARRRAREQVAGPHRADRRHHAEKVASSGAMTPRPSETKGRVRD